VFFNEEAEQSTDLVHFTTILNEGEIGWQIPSAVASVN
jgi:hypothetical protein